MDQWTEDEISFVAVSERSFEMSPMEKVLFAELYWAIHVGILTDELSVAFQRVFYAKVVEVRPPKPGYRHQQSERYVWHRFPVKGGISNHDVLIRQMFKPSRMNG